MWARELRERKAGAPRRSRVVVNPRKIVGFALTTLTILLAAAAPADAQVTITPVTNDAAGAQTASAALTALPGTVTNAQFDAVTGGTPNGIAEGMLNAFPTAGSSFTILTSGDVNLADDANTAGNTGVSNNGGNVRGDTDFDVTVLRTEVQAPPGANCLTLDFKFFSDEFPEFVGKSFNDAFIAELDSSTWTTSGNVISAPNNFAFDPAGNEISVNAAGNTSMTAAEATDTTYDGATPLLSASKQVTPGMHTLFLSIFDQGDHIYDSAVFLDNLRIGFVPAPAVNCKPGAVPVNFVLTLAPATATNQVGTSHTVTATLTDDAGTPVSGAAVNFKVVGVNPATGTVTTDAAGHASFSYTGVNPGTDMISGCYDADNDGQCEALASATKIWTPPPFKLDHFECYQSHNLGHRFHPRSVVVKDQFGTHRVQVRRPDRFCNPASKNGSAIRFPKAHLNCYAIGGRDDDDRDDDSQPMHHRLVRTHDQFGTHTLRVGNAADLCLPASKSVSQHLPGPPPRVLDHFQCYRAQLVGHFGARRVVVTDQFGTKRLVAVTVEALCAPASKNGSKVAHPAAHLTCYRVRAKEDDDDSHKDDGDTARHVVWARDQFGLHRLSLTRTTTLCLPTSKRLLHA